MSGPHKFSILSVDRFAGNLSHHKTPTHATTHHSTHADDAIAVTLPEGIYEYGLMIASKKSTLPSISIAGKASFPTQRDGKQRPEFSIEILV